MYRGIFLTKGPIYCYLDPSDLNLLSSSRRALHREMARAESDPAMKVAGRKIYIAAFYRKPPFYFYPERVVVSTNTPPAKKPALKATNTAHAG